MDTDKDKDLQDPPKDTPPADTGKDSKALEDRIKFLEEESKKAFDERDKAKKKLKDIDDDKAKKNGEFENLLKERETELENIKKELEETKTYKEKFEKIEADARKELLEQIEDKDLKALAEKYSTDDLKVLVSKIGKTVPIGDKGGRYTPPNGKEKSIDDKYKSMYKTK